MSPFLSLVTPSFVVLKRETKRTSKSTLSPSLLRCPSFFPPPISVFPVSVVVSGVQPILFDFLRSLNAQDGLPVHRPEVQLRRRPRVFSGSRVMSGHGHGSKPRVLWVDEILHQKENPLEPIVFCIYGVIIMPGFLSVQHRILGFSVFGELIHRPC